ncbi:hypothetical protein GF324_08235 [bacterium]|nr:hypothetical protein [bacterium]
MKLRFLRYNSLCRISALLMIAATWVHAAKADTTESVRSGERVPAHETVQSQSAIHVSDEDGAPISMRNWLDSGKAAGPFPAIQSANPGADSVVSMPSLAVSRLMEQKNEASEPQEKAVEKDQQKRSYWKIAAPLILVAAFGGFSYMLFSLRYAT